MPATTTNRQPRHLLAVVRARHGYTCASYASAVGKRAAKLGYGSGSWRREKVARWEAGVEPAMYAQLAMADLLRVDPDEVIARGWPNWLLLALPGPDVLAPFTPEVTLSALDDLTTGKSQANGADVPLLPPSVLEALTMQWTEHVQETIAHGIHGGYVGVEVSTAIHSRLTALWHLDDSLGGTPCTTSARTDLHMVTRLLRNARHRGQLTTDLHYLAAEYARFLGWAEFDAGRPAKAQRAWHTALRASAEAADPVHGAYLLANLALACVYDDQPNVGTGLLTSARELVGTRTTPLVEAMIDTWRVRATAATGDAKQAARLLAQAEREYERAREGDENPPWAYWMCRPSHMAETGRAFLDIGDPATAESLLTDGLAALEPNATRDRVLYLTWIATAQARRRELDAAAHTATTAMDIAATVESGRCANLLSSLITELTPHRQDAPIAAALERLSDGVE
ncbi:transcriptional regulator [Streptomyces sp. G-5]|uniref:transcriptional regulator n=1 Tax=Streptomyces sp. G-5 TaxID=2977231 RepID=UPI0021D1908E|nr:transcriptional regulator [Streptomyces sp. G-5]MCU4750255.1 transcriptional regulator [Streptomyces sp. G-5]